MSWPRKKKADMDPELAMDDFLRDLLDGDEPVVNVWNADAYGNGEDSGTRWTLYRDDPESGAMTDADFADGQVQMGHEYFGADDDWLYGDDARDFLMTVTVEGFDPKKES